MRIALFACLLLSCLNFAAAAGPLMNSRVEAILESKRLKGEHLKNFIAVKEDERYLGSTPKEGKATVIIYGSLTCGHCAHIFMTTVDKLKSQFWNKKNSAVTLVHRSFVGDKPALMATKLLMCHHVPYEKYYRLLRTLYSTQETWAYKDYETSLCDMALAFGLSKQQFRACEASCRTEEILRGRIDMVEKVGLRATPMVFVNGNVIEEPSASSIVDAVAKELVK